MSYSLIVLPLAQSNLSKAVRERESIATKRALLAEINASFERFPSGRVAIPSCTRKCAVR